jgi:hypothetical protein
MTVVAEHRGPADRVAVGMGSMSGAGDYGAQLGDRGIRQGATLRLDVGDEVWAFASGPRAGTLAGELDGDALVVSDWVEGPNYPHSWVAVRPGGTTVTLTIEAEDRLVELGQVTVVVR